MLPSWGKGQRPRYQRPVRQPRWADLWQIPLFCLGIAVLLAVLWHYPTLTVQRHSLQNLYQQALQAIDQKNLELAQHRLQQLLNDPHAGDIPEPDRLYLQGSVLLAEAQLQSPVPPRTPETREAYARARQHLEKVLSLQQKHLPTALHYRLALATLGAGGSTPQQLDALEQSLEANFTDRPEGYPLLAQLRLQLAPPDYAGALRAIDLQLSMTKGTQQYALRLQKAEILTLLERWTEIPKAISSIPPEANEYQAALQWQALAAYQQKQWGEAARLWALVSPRDLSPRALLYYGQCQQKLKNFSEATRLWERLWRESLQSAEALVAQCYLAELAQDQARWHDAVSALAAVMVTNEPSRFANPYLSKDELKEKVSILAGRMVQLRRWDDLRLLGEAATRWQFGGLADAWLAQAWHGIAEAGTTTTPSLPGNKAYAQAADYAYKAAQLLSGEEKQRLLLQAGQDALKARAYKQAQRALAELLSLKPDATLKPAILLGLAETLIEQKQLVLAADRLREALEYPGSHEASARLKLALLLLTDERQSSEAGKQLELAAGLVSRPDSGPEARTACHRWAAYLFHSVMMQKNSKSLQAMDACEKALKFASPHPEAAQTRYLLAELLLAEARVESSESTFLRKQGEQLWQACQFFQKASEELLRPDSIITSTQNKDAFIRYAKFGQAECWFRLGEKKPFLPNDAPSADVCWQKAADLYQALSDTSTHRVESLYAYLWLSRCQEKRGLFAEMRETRRDALQQLQEMTDDELKLHSRFEPLKRSQWEALFQAPMIVDRGQP